ncbi:MAG: GNAT family N-acetyltransferase [Pseudolysinimonas sp.]
MISTQSVSWTDPRVAALHAALSAETGAMYKDLLDSLTPEALAAARASLAIEPAVIEATLLILDGDTSVGTGAIRRSVAAPETEWEVKRVYVADSYRGRGLSRTLMLDLEARAKAAGARSMVLQTGGRQDAAHGLYESLGYQRVEAFPPYGTYPQERYYRKAL